MQDKRRIEVELFFSNEMLHAYGCENCIFREIEQCPHSLADGEKYKNGYCQKLIDFLTHLAEDGDSISSVKEKFHIFVQEMQALTDRKEYLKVQAEYDRLEKEGGSGEDLARLYGKLSSYKTWWARLSESVVKGLGRIADREQKTKSDITPKLTVQQLNDLMRESRKLLEDQK